MKNINFDNIVRKILVVFLIIQPIFDLKIFYNSISTLIRVIIIFALFSYYFFTSKNKRKYLLLLYPCLLGIYFIFHHFNALHFTSLVPGNFNYSILKEFLYFVKMVSPFLLIYSLYKAKPSFDSVIDIMKDLTLIIGLVIIISNIFTFSYGSYSNSIIKANFFEWFNPNSNYTYYDLASKGLFEFGNQISAILIMFLPFMIYRALNNHKIINYFVLCVNILSLILLCTKVSVLGIFIVFGFTIFAFLFVSFINKKHILFKDYIPMVVLIIVNCILLPFNPMFNRIQERATVVENYNSNEIIEITQEDSNFEITVDSDNSIQVSDDDTVQDSSDIFEYIENNYQAKKIPEQFLYENYPYKYDPEFWYDFLQNDITLTTDYRFIELSMVQRVVEINNNPMDKWFGITNTRLQNVFNIEKDFVVQYYALGIIGMLLVLAPYFILLGIFAYKIIKEKFKNLNVVNLLGFITVLFLFCIAYFTGNLLNSLSFTIYFALCFYLFISFSPL